MRIISHAFVDQHRELLRLVRLSKQHWESRLAAAQVEFEKASEAMKRFETLPWFKRIFVFFTPTTEHQLWVMFCVKSNLKLLERLETRLEVLAKENLSVELNDEESAILQPEGANHE